MRWSNSKHGPINIIYFFRHRAECAIWNDYIVNVNYVYRGHMTYGCIDDKKKPFDSNPLKSTNWFGRE